jgi:hypothetical protein
VSARLSSTKESIAFGRIAQRDRRNANSAIKDFPAAATECVRAVSLWPSGTTTHFKTAYLLVDDTDSSTRTLLIELSRSRDCVHTVGVRDQFSLRQMSVTIELKATRGSSLA